MSYTLLLVDENVTTHRVVELTFADEDVRVVAVSDGQQAIERMVSEPPDIVLAEVSVPRVNGFELAQYVTKQPHLTGVPVLLLSGAFDTIDERRVRESGAAGIIVKPFEPAVVISRVKELLGLGSNEEAPARPAGARMIPPAERPAARPAALPRMVAPPKPSMPHAGVTAAAAHVASTTGPPAPAPSPTGPSATISRPAAGDDVRGQTGSAPDTAPIQSQSSRRADYLERLDAALDTFDTQLPVRSQDRPATSRTEHRDSGRRLVQSPFDALEAAAHRVARFDTRSSEAELAAPNAPVAFRPEAQESYGGSSPKRPEGREGGSVITDDVIERIAKRVSELCPAPSPAASVQLPEDLLERIAERVVERHTPTIAPAVQVPDEVVERIATQVSARQQPLPVPTIEVPEGVIERIAMRVGERLVPAPSAPPAIEVPEGVIERIAMRVGERLAPPLPSSPPPALDLSDEAIQRISSRIAERLTEGVLIDTVTQVVSAVTERLVREEIARIRAKAQPLKD